MTLFRIVSVFPVAYGAYSIIGSVGYGVCAGVVIVRAGAEPVGGVKH